MNLRKDCTYVALTHPCESTWLSLCIPQTYLSTLQVLWNFYPQIPSPGSNPQGFLFYLHIPCLSPTYRFIASFTARNHLSKKEEEGENEKAKAEEWLEHMCAYSYRGKVVLKDTLQCPNTHHCHCQCSLPKKHSDKGEKTEWNGWAGKEEVPLDNRLAPECLPLFCIHMYRYGYPTGSYCIIQCDNMTKVITITGITAISYWLLTKGPC